MVIKHNMVMLRENSESVKQVRLVLWGQSKTEKKPGQTFCYVIHSFSEEWF